MQYVCDAKEVYILCILQAKNTAGAKSLLKQLQKYKILTVTVIIFKTIPPQNGTYLKTPSVAEREVMYSISQCQP